MKRLEALRAKLNTALANWKAVSQKAADEDRNLTADEREQIAGYKAEVEALKGDIANEEQLVAAEANAPTVDEPAAVAAPAAASVAMVTPEPRPVANTTSGPGGVPHIDVHFRADDDPQRGFRHPREFIVAVMAAGRYGDSGLDDRLKPLREATRAAEAMAPVEQLRAAAGSDEHTGAADPYGGFAIPEGFSPDMLRLAPEADPTSGTRRIPMQSPVVKIPARVDKNHASSVSGGLTVSRRPETVSATASRMELEQVTLQANMLIGASHTTEELLTDSPISFAAIIASGFADEFVSKLAQERIEGTGVGEFLGILNSPALISIAKEGSQTADTLKGANIVKMRARVWRYDQAVWLANPDTYPQLAEAHLPGTNSDVAIFQPSLSADRPDVLLGRPIIFTEYAKTIGDKGDIMCCNWNEYLEGVLQGMQSAESMHVRFLNHERTFKVWLRNAGQPWWKSALTPINGSTMSPFVTLDARA